MSQKGDWTRAADKEDRERLWALMTSQVPLSRAEKDRAAVYRLIDSIGRGR